MDFKQFRVLMQSHVSSALLKQAILFTTDVDKDKLWETYLGSFPAGTNEIFRERREHDCSCCRHFVKSFGNVVAINADNQIVTVWDFETDDAAYGLVVKALSALVKEASVQDVFVTKDSGFGTDHNFEQNTDGTVRIWDHFHVTLPKTLVTKSTETIGSLTGKYRDVRNVFKRSLDEISKDAIETVLDLVSQNSLYKGEEWKGVLSAFLVLHNEYHNLLEADQDAYCWRKSVEAGGAIGKIKNHSIGVLLVDITIGMDVNDAVKRYENIVAPANYKRPKAIFTQRMIEQAQQTITDLGLLDSLPRRFAVVDDITVNNILFANRDTLKQMESDVFTELGQGLAISPKQFNKVEEIPIDKFIQEILPRTTDIEILLENRHAASLVSLIAPQNREALSLFKWNNGFSWAYAGNITDSMKERVKAAGGNVEGVLRFSLQWNTDGDNQNDFDAHCIEPTGERIFFLNKRSRRTGGELDVDIIHPGLKEIAVENITWSAFNKMTEGVYEFQVHNYTHRGGRSGFSAEIEFEGQIYSFAYNKELCHQERITIAKVVLVRNEGMKLIECLPSTTSSRQVWGLMTNQFHSASVIMLSPNYWDGQRGVGHKHHFFILRGCLNDTRPNGFFNEFLREDLMAHKRVFEALGGKMRVEPSQSQLSGLGFSSTKRSSMVCKLEGHITRTVKIVF